MKWLVGFNAEKSQLILFNWSYNTGVIDVKMGGSVFQEKLYFNMLRLSSSSKLDWCSYVISIAKTPFEYKLGLDSLYEVSFS